MGARAVSEKYSILGPRSSVLSPQSRSMATTTSMTEERTRASSASTTTSATTTTTTTTTSTTTSTTTLLEAYATHDLVESLLKSHDDDDDSGKKASSSSTTTFEDALKRRAREVETKLADVERRSVDEHAAECENLLALKDEVDACARILSSLQSKVESFQDNLGRISSDIRGLQRQSVELRVRTRNRVNAEAALGRVVQSLAIEPSLINAVFNAEDVANDDFLDALESLDAKLCAIGDMKTSDGSSPRILAVNDVAPELERLRVKACARVWKFLHGELSDLAKPLANVQQTQERVLIRYVPLIQFLRKHGKEVYWEIKALYVDVVSKSIKASVASYLEQLDKLAGRGVPAVDLASPTVSRDAHADGAGATGVGALTGMFAFASSNAAAANWTRDEVEGAFKLGNRLETVRAAETEPPLVVHVKSDKVTQSTQSIEELFRSANRLLIDTATFEYTFCEQFWRGEREVFESVFSPALATFNDFSSICVSRASRDAIGLLILICVNDAHRRVMSMRRIPALDGYFDGVNLNAWPRFKAVCDAHVQSLIDMKDSFEPKPEAPSYVVKRFVELTLALTNLAYATRVNGAASSSTKSQVDLILDRARRAMNECVSSKLCASLQGVEKSAYVIKSYDVVCSALSALALARDDEDEDEHEEHYSASEPSNELASLQYFESKLSEETTKYVDKVVASHFGELTRFGDDDERSLGDFLATWRQRLQTTHASCVSCFGGPGSRANALFVKCADAVYAAYARIDAERTLPSDSSDDPDRVSAAMFQVEVRRLVASSQQARNPTRLE